MLFPHIAAVVWNLPFLSFFVPPFSFGWFLMADAGLFGEKSIVG
jgi:hypothetical protein